MKRTNEINHKITTDEDRDSLINRKAVLKKLAALSLPLSFLGLNPQKAAAQFDNLEIGRALNLILQIEFMEEAFYIQAVSKNGLISQPYRSIFLKILRQHRNRVVLIKNNIGLLDIKPAPQLSFNFRSGDINPFRSFDDFLNLAQIIEDLSTGVYKKQADIIFRNNAAGNLRQTVVRLHSTEARHAYYVRFLRAQRGLDDIKGWINQNNLGTLSSGFVNIYTNEGNTIQSQVDVPSITKASNQAVQEAWDEPIGRSPALNILGLFTNPFEQ